MGFLFFTNGEPRGNPKLSWIRKKIVEIGLGLGSSLMRLVRLGARMLRTTRIHVPGGVFHVMLRGDAGQKIFFYLFWGFLDFFGYWAVASFIDGSVDLYRSYSLLRCDGLVFVSSKWKDNLKSF